MSSEKWRRRGIRDGFRAADRRMELLWPVCALLCLASGIQACGDSLVGSGNISSPNFPQMYPNAANCVWRLTADKGKRVRLQFLALDLEDGFDWLRVYRGEVASDERLFYAYTGAWSPGAIILDDRVTLVFSSDSSDVASGFLIRFTSLLASGPDDSGVLSSRDSCNLQGRYYCSRSARCISSLNRCDRYPDCAFGEDESNCSVSVSATVATGRDCGGTLVGHGNISSPNYPQYYPSNAYCVWSLTADPGKSIELHFVEFQLETSYDKLDIYGGSAEPPSSLLDTYTGTVLPSAANLGSVARLVFTSDQSAQYKGFFISFLSIDTAAGAVSNARDRCLVQGRYFCNLSLECIITLNVCNGWYDCQFGEDEAACPSTTAAPGQTTAAEQPTTEVLSASSAPSAMSSLPVTSSATSSLPATTRPSATPPLQATTMPSATTSLQATATPSATSSLPTTTRPSTTSSLPATTRPPASSSQATTSPSTTSSLQATTRPSATSSLPTTFGQSTTPSISTTSQTSPTSLPSSQAGRPSVSASSVPQGSPSQIGTQPVSRPELSGSLPSSSVAAASPESAASASPETTPDRSDTTSVPPIRTSQSGTTARSATSTSLPASTERATTARLGTSVSPSSSPLQGASALSQTSTAPATQTVPTTQVLPTTYGLRTTPASRTTSTSTSGKATTAGVATSAGTTTSLPSTVSKTSTDKVSCAEQGRYLCTLSSRCLDMAYVCDGFSDCVYGEDELECYYNTPHSLPSSTTKAAVTDDDSGLESCNPLDSFWCARSQLCIPKSFRCNGRRNCAYSEDEDNCQSVASTPSTARPGSTPRPTMSLNFRWLRPSSAGLHRMGWLYVLVVAATGAVLGRSHFW